MSNELKQHVLHNLYLQQDECEQDMYHRVANYVAQAEHKDKHVWAERFFNAMNEGRFLPNTPCLLNAGVNNDHTLSACFTVDIEDTVESIFDALKTTALIHTTGGGVGCNFSSVRARGAPVRDGKAGKALGPVAVIRMFNAITQEIKQAGRRRGANMGILNWDHTDIREFVDAKLALGALNNFNLSVLAPVDLASRDHDLFSLIVQRMHECGEPGLLFQENLNERNVRPDLGPITCTNPCGETLAAGPWSCNLGSINVAKFCDDKGCIDWVRFSSTTRLAIRFLDNVVSINCYPTDKHAQLALECRPIGLGIMGFADLLMMCEVPYASSRGIAIATAVASHLAREAKQASIELVEEGRSQCSKGLDPHTNKRPTTQIRNAVRTAIAPTGSISILAGCSSGIEPAFALRYTRKALGKHIEVVHPLLEQFIAENGTSAKLPEYFQTAYDVSPEMHVKMLAAFQQHVCAGVSKSINLPASATVTDVANAVKLAAQLGCNGVTVFRDKSRGEQVLKATTEIPSTQPAEQQPSDSGRYKRHSYLKGGTYEVKTGCGTAFITINNDPTTSQPIEVFLETGKTGGCTGLSEGLARILSVSLQCGLPLQVVIDQLRGIKCFSSVMAKKDQHVDGLSCPDIVARKLQQCTDIDSKLQAEIVGERACPQCSTPRLQRHGNCWSCPNCGYSTC